jgi:hypothetical protein
LFELSLQKYTLFWKWQKKKEKKNNIKGLIVGNQRVIIFNKDREWGMMMLE